MKKLEKIERKNRRKKERKKERGSYIYTEQK
jgi:hypothetical protein